MIFCDKLFPVVISLLVFRQTFFIIAFKNGYIQPVFIYFVHFGQQFPAPGDGFFFKIIAKTPVAQHFEHGMMIGINSNFFQVVMFARNA